MIETFIDAMSAYIRAFAAYEADKSSATAKALVQAAEIADKASGTVDYLPCVPYDGFRHETIQRMSDMERSLAGIREDERW